MPHPGSVAASFGPPVMHVAPALAQEAACSEFPVGSQEWTDCIEGAATGGGLMPWIVIVPLGIMVIGMAIGFFLQFRKGGQRATGSVAGTAGNWLLFVGFIELLIGGGMAVAATRADGPGGGFLTAAVVLLATAAVLFISGIAAKVRGVRKARIERNGIAGEARLLGINQTGTMINNQPVLALDLEVLVPGAAPFRKVHRETIPFWHMSKLGEGKNIPIKADPADPSSIILDWSRFGGP